MTRRLFLALLLAAATLATSLVPGTASAQTVYVQDTDDGYLNLRRGPSSKQGILMRLTAGTALQITGAQGNWRQVILPDGMRGWVHGRYIAQQYFAQRPYSFVVRRTSDGYLNMRRGPGTRFGIIRRLHAGQMLLWNGVRDGNWTQVQLPDGTNGWASLKYLTAVN
ncbi:hypothetical protein FHY55_02695 [Oceanicola sp. D3]|uniref:SH3 domain-containing protein n=1 Tax=Oceanicola sp. D3 TaxID=2587163 RepID=UPI001123CFE7|nr:SH3 domain-containing protein [Oceanicola sp. D3]QDC08219.1 hypothetical protein FHY55_02695 [Oceanicola sp. D3]